MKDRKPCYSCDAYRLDDKGRRWSVRDWVPGIPSEFIRHLRDPETLKQARQRGVVLYCRVSTNVQNANGNLHDAVAAATAELEALGIRVLAVFREVAHSSIESYRLALMRAIGDAERRGALLVAPERDRFLRCDCWHPKKARRPDTEIPRVTELVEFGHWTRGVIVTTLEHPDARGRSAQIKRGQAAKDARGGRPSPKTHGEGWRIRRRAALLPEAMRLRREGLVFADIAQELHKLGTWKKQVTAMTVCNWSKQRGTGIKFSRFPGRSESRFPEGNPRRGL